LATTQPPPANTEIANSTAISALWWQYWDCWLNIGRGLTDRKSAVSWALRSIESLCHPIDDSITDALNSPGTTKKSNNTVLLGNLSEWISLVYREEDLVMFLRLFEDIWPLLQQSSKTSACARSFGYDDFSRFCNTLRFLLTYHDLTYLPPGSAGLLELDTLSLRSPQPTTGRKAKIYLTDAEFITPIQNAVSEYLFGPEPCQKARDSLSNQVNLLVPSNGKPSSMFSLYKALIEQPSRIDNGRLASRMLEEIAEWIRLPTRNSWYWMNIEQTENCSQWWLTSTATPMTLAHSIAANNNVQQQQTGENDGKSLYAANEWMHEVLGLRSPSYIAFIRVVLNVLGEVFRSQQLCQHSAVYSYNSGLPLVLQVR
jgi:hypothetical protein